MIEIVRISEQAKIRLTTIKKRTGIENWNVICRWAFLLSIKTSGKVAFENIVTDSNVEMSWRTFSGMHDKLYLALLLRELKNQNIEINKKNVNDYFKIYLHRGISLLTNSNYKNIKSYIKIFTV